MSGRLRIPQTVRLEPSALREAERVGAVVVEVQHALDVAEAISLASTLPVPMGWDGENPDGWGIACPPGAMLRITSSVEARAGDGTRVPRGSPLLVNYAWATPRTQGDGSRRVLVRCSGYAEDRNVYPVDVYADQIATIAAIEGRPYRVAGWEIMRLDGKPAGSGGAWIAGEKSPTDAEH